MINRKTALKQLKFLESKSQEMRLAAEGWENDWQRLVAIMLSARTRDEVTILVCEKMFVKYPTPEKFSELSLNKIKKEIGSINFFNNKSKNLFLMNKKLLLDFEGKVPRKVEDLILLAGIGRKTANVFLAEDGEPHIGVDTHVSYISQHLGWVNSSKPEVIEKQLEKLFPKSAWARVNRALVRFGKTYTSRKEKDDLLNWVKENVSELY
jgi:endonuclease-3